MASGNMSGATNRRALMTISHKAVNDILRKVMLPSEINKSVTQKDDSPDSTNDTLATDCKDPEQGTTYTDRPAISSVHTPPNLKTLIREVVDWCAANDVFINDADQTILTMLSECDLLSVNGGRDWLGIVERKT